MKVSNIKRSTLLLTIFYSGLLVITASHAETEETTATTTNRYGSTTTTVEETTTTREEKTPTQEIETVPVVGGRNIVGPTGATGTIRRSDRRQDRRGGDPRLDNDDRDVNINTRRDLH